MKEFSIQRRIYYHNTDAGGVVYYADYLALLEEGRTDLCLARGVDTRALMDRGIVFPVVHVEAEYKSPARYGDVVTITTTVERVGNSSITFSQKITRDDRLLVAATTVWACVDLKAGGSVAVPEDIASKLTGGSEKNG